MNVLMGEGFMDNATFIQFVENRITVNLPASDLGTIYDLFNFATTGNKFP